MTYADSVQYCRRIQKKYSSKYYLATLFFPKDARDAIFVLYAFFRIPDEYVDSVSSAEESRQLLAEWISNWKLALAGEEVVHPVLYGAREVFRRYQIPEEYSFAFLEAMVSDLSVKEYQTYKDLQEYMYGSAMVVGLMVTYVLGFSGTDTLRYAKLLGEAMQMTNFLRDMYDDAHTRDRVYIPVEDLKQFSLSPDGIHKKTHKKKITELLVYEIARTRSLYTEARIGIASLQSGRFAVLLSSYLYEAVLDQIERQGYDVTTRASVGFFRKIYYIVYTYAHKNW